MSRLAGLALAASLLHLNVVRADIACGSHNDGSDTAHGTTEHVMHHAVEIDSDIVQVADAEDGAAHDQPCDTPIQPDCCQALASCSPVFGGEVESVIGTYVPSQDVAVNALIEIPLSRVTTPDPPPPKA